MTTRKSDPFGPYWYMKDYAKFKDEVFEKRVRLKWLQVGTVSAGLLGFLFFFGFIRFLPELTSYPLESTLSLMGLATMAFAIIIFRVIGERLLRLDNEFAEIKAARIATIASQQAAEAARYKRERMAREDRERLTEENSPDRSMAGRTRPEPQPYGVSNEGAEHYVASWLEYLGQFDVSITTFSGDGGIDVLSRDYVCQVKNYRSQPVTVSEVRDLFGTAVSEGRKAVLFTSSPVTQQGVEFADRNQVALVRFLPQEGKLDAINMHGISFLNDGSYDSD